MVTTALLELEWFHLCLQLESLFLLLSSTSAFKKEKVTLACYDEVSYSSLIFCFSFFYLNTFDVLSWNFWLGNILREEGGVCSICCRMRSMGSSRFILFDGDRRKKKGLTTMAGGRPSQGKSRRHIVLNELEREARERKRSLRAARASLSIPSIGEITPARDFHGDSEEATNLQTPTTRSTPSDHSAIAGDASTSAAACLPSHPFNIHPNRAAKRVQNRGARLSEQSQKARKSRGSNKANKLHPDIEKGETAWPLYVDSKHHLAGDYAEKWGKYLGEDSHHYGKYPLHMEWGEEHNKSFDAFWSNAQKFYQILPQDPNLPLNHLAIYQGAKLRMQERVRYRRCQVKNECYTTWNDTPEGDREALYDTPAFSLIDRDKWPALCAYFASEDKKIEAARNTENRASNKNGRATYTGGSRNMSRAMEKLRGEIIDAGGRPILLKLYLGTHSSAVDKSTGDYIYPDASTKDYCTRVIEKATSSGVNSTIEDDTTAFTQLLDSMHGGHHGGYERGQGISAPRSYWRASSVLGLGANPELIREMADLRSRLSEMDELKAEMQWLRSQMVNSQSTCPIPSPQPSTDPPFTRHAPVSQPRTNPSTFARPETATCPSSSAQGSTPDTARGLSQEDIAKMFADLRCSGLSQEDILRGISTVP